MSQRRRAGFTLIEMMIVVGILAAIAAMAVFGTRDWFRDQNVKSAARSISDAFLLARSEAVRTGNNHLVVFGMALGATAPIVIVNDGAPSTANCQIDAGEVVHTVAAEPDVSWGTSSAASNGTLVPDDPGASPSTVTSGWTFANGTGSAAASWVLFRADGLPRTFTPSGSACAPIGPAGQGGGGIYVSNGRRDYAVVLRPLGTSAVFKWDPGAGAWRN